MRERNRQPDAGQTSEARGGSRQSLPLCLLAFALLGPAGILYDIVVDPSYRGRGIGRALLGAIIAELRARGAPRVLLSRAVRNEAAKRLFESTGFRETMVEMTCDLEPLVDSDSRRHRQLY